MNKDNLKRLIVMALCCDLGLFSKRLIAPAANVLTDALHIPGGIGTAFSLMFLIVAVGLMPKVLVRHDHGCGAERYRSFFGNGGQHGGSVPDRLHCPRICHRLRHVGSEKARCENAIRFRACEYALGSGCEHHRKLYRISFERSCTAAVCFGRTDKRCNMWCSGKRAARTAAKSQTN